MFSKPKTQEFQKLINKHAIDLFLGISDVVSGPVCHFCPLFQQVKQQSSNTQQKKFSPIMRFERKQTRNRPTKIAALCVSVTNKDVIRARRKG